MAASRIPYLKQVQTKLRVELHPSQAESVVAGVHEHLNSLIMRYREEFGGVVLAYSDVILSSSKGRILTSLSPYIHLDLTAKLLVFAPAAKNVLVGSVNKVGPAHIGLLALGVFNGSIGADKIGDAYQYDHMRSAWASDEATIAVDTEIKFAVERVHDEGSFLSLSGSLVSLDTGAATQGALEASEPRGDDGGATEPTQVAGRKRKAQQTSLEHAVRGNGTATQRDSQSDVLVETGERKKKKKKAKEVDVVEGAASEGGAQGGQQILENLRQEHKNSKEKRKHRKA